MHCQNSPHAVQFLLSEKVHCGLLAILFFCELWLIRATFPVMSKVMTLLHCCVLPASTFVCFLKGLHCKVPQEPVILCETMEDILLREKSAETSHSKFALQTELHCDSPGSKIFVLWHTTFTELHCLHGSFHCARFWKISALGCGSPN